MFLYSQGRLLPPSPACQKPLPIMYKCEFRRLCEELVIAVFIFNIRGADVTTKQQKGGFLFTVAYCNNEYCLIQIRFRHKTYIF